MTTAARVVDAALEASVVGSFTRAGIAVRRRMLPEWDAPLPRLDGRVVLVTGATSGLGEAAAGGLRDLGAEVVGASRSTGLDLADLAAVRAYAAGFAERHGRLDVLVHNAGALYAEHGTSPDGLERTVATNVAGPFLLTALLLPLLRATPGSRVVTVSSGGMYSQRLDVAGLQMPAAGYRGATAYARAKRAQVALTAEWARREPAVAFHAMHPGWADTPGLARSLPRFRTALRPLLRTAEQGADTVVWLAAAVPEQLGSGRFWHDRRPRGVHRVPWTRGGDPAALWEWAAAATGYSTTGSPPSA